LNCLYGREKDLEEGGLGGIETSTPRWDDDIDWSNEANSSRSTNLTNALPAITNNESVNRHVLLKLKKPGVRDF